MFKYNLLLKCVQITFELYIIFNLLVQRLWKTCIYFRVLKSVACMEVVRKAADEIRIKIFSNPRNKENK
jgi:hypothetical protein